MHHNHSSTNEGVAVGTNTIGLKREESKLSSLWAFTKKTVFVLLGGDHYTAIYTY